VQLEVLFSKKGNSCREPIWFEVVDISSPYHALLGRPALAKFMAVPHYAYLKMKLPGPRGVITVSGSFKKSLAGAKESSQLAEALVVAEEKRQLLHRMELTQQDVLVRQSPVEQFKPSIKPSPESISIYVPGDPAPAQVPPPDPGAAVSGLKEAAGQPSMAGSTKEEGTAGSTPAPPAEQTDEAGQRRTRGLLILWSPVSSTYGRYLPGRSHSPTTSSLGTCRRTKRKPGEFSVELGHTPSSTANCTSAACQASSKSASNRRKG
jgi:hypothetical protein